jgi:hypothetical protein
MNNQISIGMLVMSVRSLGVESPYRSYGAMSEICYYVYKHFVPTGRVRCRNNVIDCFCC